MVELYEERNRKGYLADLERDGIPARSFSVDRKKLFQRLRAHLSALLKR